MKPFTGGTLAEGHACSWSRHWRLSRRAAARQEQDGVDDTGATANLPTSIGKGEGKLNLIAWEGYTQPEWVKKFDAADRLQGPRKDGGSSDQMVTLMRQAGRRRRPVGHGLGLRRREPAPDQRRRRQGHQRRP